MKMLNVVFVVATVVALICSSRADARTPQADRARGGRLATSSNAVSGTAGDHIPAKLTAGVIVGMVNADKMQFRVKLDEPFDGQDEISVWCKGPTVIMLDGQPSTFQKAVVAGRRVAFEHVRGATPYVSVMTPATD